jgi:hypothetical protein
MARFRKSDAGYREISDQKPGSDLDQTRYRMISIGSKTAALFLVLTFLQENGILQTASERRSCDLPLGVHLHCMMPR